MAPSNPARPSSHAMVAIKEREDRTGPPARMALRELWFWHVCHRAYFRAGQLLAGRRVHGCGPLLVAMGDSLTDPFIGFTFPRLVWTRLVARHGYKTLNLGVGGDTTANMRRRVDQFLDEGRPEIAVLFAGTVDAELGVDCAETERNVRFIVEWLRDHEVDRIVLIGPGMLNLPWDPAWRPSSDAIRAILREIAVERGAVFIDLAEYLGDRIARGEDPDFSRVPYRQSRSPHAWLRDGHFNAYGQRLVAEAFLAATAEWRTGPRSASSLPGHVGPQRSTTGH